MPITEEIFNGLGEDEQTFWMKNDEGAYVIDPSKIDQGEELKGALQKERASRKEAEKEAAKLKREREEADRARKEEDNQFKELYQTEKQKREEIENRNKNILKNSFTGKISSSLSSDKAKKSLIEKQLADFVIIEDDDVKIQGIAGVENEEDLITHFKEKYPFLVDGTKAKGGDAGGNDGGGTVDSLLKTDDEVNKMTPAEKMDFFKKGGKRKTKE